MAKYRERRKLTAKNHFLKGVLPNSRVKGAKKGVEVVSFCLGVVAYFDIETSALLLNRPRGRAKFRLGRVGINQSSFNEVNNGYTVQIQ
uniref:Uncharacterized protein n=1 Tax=Candidatus Kentrum sp. TC TaxID=2126339 RepID=A0A450YQZ1_9GAMM|nr:MAG: hypothetical protein BECKTC1821E_GA0114239_100488 [Candidatus Kentron sp. TC]VFK43916.1 MAG: hypothetical protein BECKTC1821D_GA0114238_101915 [Candidatus Kentron sp. TC]